jgi:hypothetical protein
MAELIGCIGVLQAAAINPRKTPATQERVMAEFKIGRRSPDFSLESINGSGGSRKQVSLDDYIDGWLVLLFYPKDFSMI